MFIYVQIVRPHPPMYPPIVPTNYDGEASQSAEPVVVQLRKCFFCRHHVENMFGLLLISS